MKTYSGETLGQIAYPLGGIGAGTLCLQGTGTLGNVALRNRPNYRNDPMIFAALSVKGENGFARILETPVPNANVFIRYPDASLGLTGKCYGLPRFQSGNFSARFPFAHLDLTDDRLPVDAHLIGWSPFVPGDDEASSLPFAALEYTFINKTDKRLDAVYYFCAENFMKVNDQANVYALPNGFVLNQPSDPGKPEVEGAFCAAADGDVAVDTAWLRENGGWSFDVLTMLWKGIKAGLCASKAYAKDDLSPGPGGTLAIPFALEPNGKKTVRIRLCWYVPGSDVRAGSIGLFASADSGAKLNKRSDAHSPWYSAQYSGIETLSADWGMRYQELRDRTSRFAECFYDTTLPDELIDAVGANLCILKSPTILRQRDGKLWGWEGCHDDKGSCHGSCTHVWNYAQAICNLFPKLERSLRDTEFFMTQTEEGHQTFRATLPIQKMVEPSFYAASDGQLGGIIKVYRDFRISSDWDWLKGIWPKVKESLAYCIKTWDPVGEGVLKEPHHNTYDIEFWGADGMCSCFYLGALRAAAALAETLGEDPSTYLSLYEKGRTYMQEKLFTGEYFQQNVQWEGLNAQLALEGNPPEVQEILRREGPRYQYGTGCISDGVLGVWMAEISGIHDILDDQMLRKNLESIYRYNFKADLSEHENPQRPGFALNDDGGLLLCTWPHEGKPSLPFVYSDEVWTGIEYQVASHLLIKGYAKEALDIVGACRKRYDGTSRNPYDEYECGHWYARAMASYALLQGYTGVYYDKVDKALHASLRNSVSYRTFLAVDGGYGTVEVRDGKANVTIVEGIIDIKKIIWDM